MAKDMHHVSVTDTNLTRNDFTRHRLHMNSTCKEKITKIIGQKITNLLTSQISPISLKLKKVPLSTSTDDAKMEMIIEVQEEPKLEGANTVSNNVNKESGQIIYEEQANRDQEQKED